MIRRCGWCRNKFEAPDSKVKIGLGRYCSKSCAMRRPFNKHRTRNGILYIYHNKSVIKADANDIHVLNKHAWCIAGKYARNSDNLAMHLLLMGKAPTGMCADHINRNTLDNRRLNLRFVTFSENCRNRTTRNKSRCLGVRCDGKGRYTVQIKAQGKQIYLGCYLEVAEAIKARKEAEIKYWGYNIKNT